MLIILHNAIKFQCKLVWCSSVKHPDEYRSSCSPPLSFRLKFVFGSCAVQALDLVDKQSVTCLSSPSGRKAYQVCIFLWPTLDNTPVPLCVSLSLLECSSVHLPKFCTRVEIWGSCTSIVCYLILVLQYISHANIVLFTVICQTSLVTSYFADNE